MRGNNSEVAQMFANKHDSGQTSIGKICRPIVHGNLFILGNTIYSYGNHFPIAKWIKHNEVVYNSNSYSNSTSKHQGLVRLSLLSSNVKIWECPMADPVQKTDDVYLILKDACYLATWARSKFSEYVDIIFYWINNWSEWENRFDLKKDPFDALALPESADGLRRILNSDLVSSEDKIKLTALVARKRMLKAA